jgi:hypothetical protein
LLPCGAHKAGGRDNRNAAERIEGEQVGVAAHDKVGVAVERQRQEFLVSRVTPGWNDGLPGDDGGAANRTAPRLKADRFALLALRPAGYSKSARSIASPILL